MIVLAVLLPWLALLFHGKIVQGVLCLILQLTVIGWLPAAIWAVAIIMNDRAEERHRELVDAVRTGQPIERR